MAYAYEVNVVPSPSLFRFVRALSVSLMLAAPFSLPLSTDIIDRHARAPAEIASRELVHVGEHVGLVGAALGS